MEKIPMREWVASLEEVVDNKLIKWRKGNPVENPEAVSLQWQFEQSLMIITITWNDRQETVIFHCVGPTTCHRYIYFGLTNKTFNKICDRVGNLAQIIMHPPIDPLD